MISKFKIKIGTNKETREIELTCDSSTTSITLSVGEKARKTYTASNFYKCFGLIRKDNPAIIFFCKGSKINVHPSSMSAQMSLGLKAYELTIGKEPSLDDIVFIFDYEDQNLTNEPDEQRRFFLEWINH